jgi:protein phosphatase
MAQFSLYGGSDRGLVRKNNEDSIRYQQFEHAPVVLAVVADGVGGHEGGEIASALAVDSIEAHVRKCVLQATSGGGYGDPWPQQILLDAIEEANQLIHQQRQQQRQLASMATTVVAALILEHRLALANLGDSRCYLWREQQLQLLSHDHTVAQQMIDDGNFNEQQMKFTPYHHVLSRALGMDLLAEVDVRSMDTQGDDIYLLCSDGLTNCLSDEQIADILRRKADIDDCTEELIASANDAGGNDNISVVLVRVDD